MLFYDLKMLELAENLSHFICQLLSFGEEAEDGATTITTSTTGGMRFVNDSRDNKVRRNKTVVSLLIFLLVNFSSIYTYVAVNTKK